MRSVVILRIAPMRRPRRNPRCQGCAVVDSSGSDWDRHLRGIPRALSGYMDRRISGREKSTQPPARLPLDWPTGNPTAR